MFLTIKDTVFVFFCFVFVLLAANYYWNMQSVLFSAHLIITDLFSMPFHTV